MSLTDLVLADSTPLAPEELNRLIRLAQEGDNSARDEAIQANLRLVLSVVKRFINFGYEIDDLFQIGCLGLFKAIDRFDPCRGLMFSTYAVPLIIGEVRSFIRDDGPVKVSRGLKEQFIKVSAARQRYIDKNSTEPSLSELAKATGLSAEDIVAAQDAVNRPLSLNEVVYAGDGREVYREETLAADEDDVERTVDLVSLTRVLEALEPRERQILLLRYMHNYSQVQIAERFGISQVHVSRLIKKALSAAQEVLES